MCYNRVMNSKVYVKVTEYGVEIEVSRGILPAQWAEIIMRDDRPTDLIVSLPITACDVEGRFSKEGGWTELVRE